jgi:isopentenyl phosphate kinase
VTTVLKLGGSVVTEKDEPETVDEATLSAVSKAIAAERPERLVIVHGGGSFGHVAAAERDVSTTEGTQSAADVAAIHGTMGELNAAVCGALREQAVPAVPLRPLSMAHKSAEGALSVTVDALAALLEEGFVPVAHGDVVAHAGRGATVASGDELVVRIAERLVAERVGLCSTVPGVLDSDGGVIEHIESYDAAADALGESDATDVTGGMAGKVRTLLELTVPTAIFGPGDLEVFLDGDLPGTTVG